MTTLELLVRTRRHVEGPSWWGFDEPHGGRHTTCVSQFMQQEVRREYGLPLDNKSIPTITARERDAVKAFTEAMTLVESAALRVHHKKLHPTRAVIGRGNIAIAVNDSLGREAVLAMLDEAIRVATQELDEAIRLAAQQLVLPLGTMSATEANLATAGD